MRTLATFLAATTMAGCATIDPAPVDVTAARCESLGVSTNQAAPMQPVVLEISATVGGVAKRCGGDGPYFTKLGCIFESAPGEYTIVHSGRISRYHEWCHAAFGPKHK